jgi:hypothetical protein
MEKDWDHQQGRPSFHSWSTTAVSEVTWPACWLAKCTGPSSLFRCFEVVTTRHWPPSSDRITETIMFLYSGAPRQVSPPCVCTQPKSQIPDSCNPCRCRKLSSLCSLETQLITTNAMKTKQLSDRIKSSLIIQVSWNHPPVQAHAAGSCNQVKLLTGF